MKDQRLRSTSIHFSRRDFFTPQEDIYKQEPSKLSKYMLFPGQIPPIQKLDAYVISSNLPFQKGEEGAFKKEQLAPDLMASIAG